MIDEQGQPTTVATGRVMQAPLPQPRGRLSTALIHNLRTDLPWRTDITADSEADAQIALWTLYELHYHGVSGVSADREWDPDLLRTRRQLEHEFETTLRSRMPPLPADPDDPVRQLANLVEEYDGLSVSAFVQRHADTGQVRELMAHRSIYHLKEADPTAWVIPRLGVVSKAALMELQFDEYGNGDPNRLHHELFRRGMIESGLEAGYGHYIDQVPVEILALNNAMSLFGLHRRLRGAMLGHLVAFETTSPTPCRKMARGLRRLGYPDSLIHYYDEHIEADAVHEQLALHAIAGAFAVEHPEEWPQVLLGAHACLDLENRYAHHILETWGATMTAGPRNPTPVEPPSPPRFDHPTAIECPEGPLLLRGDHLVPGPDGELHPTTRAVSAVCRCGGSSLRPWCDGTHKHIRVRRLPSAGEPEQPSV